MVRDMELVRKIMLKMESGELSGGVEGYTDDAVNYHKALLVERGLLEGSPLYTTGKNSSPNIPTNVFIKKLTWEGHDFIDGISAGTKWNKVKAFLTDSGGHNDRNDKICCQTPVWFWLALQLLV